MQTSVSLQAPFSYSILYIIIVAIPVIAITGLYIYKHFKKKAKPKIVIKKVAPEDRDSIKRKYLDKLRDLKVKTEKNEIESRAAYIELSSIIRFFVYELTNVQVQNYTLKEIKEINLPILYELIKECYIPEFAEKFPGDIVASIEKTRKVIEKWK